MTYILTYRHAYSQPYVIQAGIYMYIQAAATKHAARQPGRHAETQANIQNCRHIARTGKAGHAVRQAVTHTYRQPYTQTGDTQGRQTKKPKHIQTGIQSASMGIMQTYRAFRHAYQHPVKYTHAYIHTYIHTYRHAYTQAYRQKDRHTYRQADIQSYIYTAKHQTGRHTGIHTGRQAYIHKYMIYIHTYIHRYIHTY